MAHHHQMHHQHGIETDSHQWQAQADAYETFQGILTRLEGEKEISTDCMHALYGLFKTTLPAALDLVDRGITKKVSPSGRALFEIQGSSGKHYLCLPYSNYCQCASYAFAVMKQELFLCKHALAGRIANALGKASVKHITDQDFVAFLCYEEMAAE